LRGWGASHEKGLFSFNLQSIVSFIPPCAAAHVRLAATLVSPTAPTARTAPTLHCADRFPPRIKKKMPPIPKSTAVRDGVAHSPIILDAVAGCSGAVVGQVLSSEPNTSGGKTKGHKLLVECGEQKPVVVVCHVPVDVDALVCVALAGSLIGEQVVEENAVVKGVVTGGQICTSAMLGWDNAEKDSGVVELRAGSLLIGDPAPGERPKARKAKTLDALGNEVALNEQVDALFVTKPKVSKEERAAEREAKRALKGKDKEDGKDDPAEVALGENGKPVASKAQTKLLKKQIADKRKAGEEVYTDDEFEGAGFAPP
jgi:hypothetical protein